MSGQVDRNWRPTGIFRDALKAGLLTAASLLVLAGPALAAPLPSDFDTPEYYASGGLAQIHADEAYALGYTGAGITVAVFDTGIDPSHSEFAGKTISGYDYIFGSSTSLFDPNGHGTFDAGIVAANRDGTGMQGIAYGANIMSFDFLYAPDYLGAFMDGIDRMIASNVRIANNSWVTFLDRSNTALMDTLHSKLTNAENHGVIFVFASGNLGDSKPWDPADIPEFMPDLQKQWIAVTAVDANNQIAAFANRCGPDAAWCIAAPGVDIYSAIPGGGYAYASGTSMAAPFVSGTVALVEQAFPYMTPEQWVQTILTTATPIGPANIYGHGLLNVGAAVRGPGSFDMDWSVDTAGYNSIWSNDISGAGGLTKAGDGILVLDGQDTYVGPTVINGGTLQIGDATHSTASIASTVQVNAGGTLSGHGTINGNVTNAGTVSPGGSIGTLTISKSYTQSATGTLNLDLAPSGGSTLAVSGGARLNGTLALNYLSGSYLATVFPLVTAGSISGQFASVTKTGAPDLQQFYTYAQHALDLTIQPANDVVVTSLTTAAIDSAHRSTAAVLSRAGLNQADTDARSGVWLKTQGQFDQYRSSVPGAKFSTNDATVLAGVDHRYDFGLNAGVAGGFTHVDLQQRGEQANGSADLYQIMFYGGYNIDDIMMSASAGYTMIRFQTQRHFLATSGPQTPGASYDGRIASAAIQAAKQFSIGTFSLTPKAGLDFAHLERARGVETGSPAFDLAFGSGSTDSLRPFAGVELSGTYQTDGGADLMPSLQIGYSHEVVSVQRSLVASLARGSNSLETVGLSPARDMVTIGGGIKVRVDSRLYLNVEAEAGLPIGNHSSQTISADLEYRF